MCKGVTLCTHILHTLGISAKIYLCYIQFQKALISKIAISDIEKLLIILFALNAVIFIFLGFFLDKNRRISNFYFILQFSFHSLLLTKGLCIFFSNTWFPKFSFIQHEVFLKSGLITPQTFTYKDAVFLISSSFCSLRCPLTWSERTVRIRWMTRTPPLVSNQNTRCWGRRACSGRAAWAERTWSSPVEPNTSRSRGSTCTGALNVRSCRSWSRTVWNTLVCPLLDMVSRAVVWKMNENNKGCTVSAVS